MSVRTLHMLLIASLIAAILLQSPKRRQACQRKLFPKLHMVKIVRRA